MSSLNEGKCKGYMHNSCLFISLHPFISIMQGVYIYICLAYRRSHSENERNCCRHKTCALYVYICPSKEFPYFLIRYFNFWKGTFSGNCITWMYISGFLGGIISAERVESHSFNIFALFKNHYSTTSSNTAQYIQRPFSS